MCCARAATPVGWAFLPVPQVVRDDPRGRTGMSILPRPAGCARRSARTDRNVHPTASRRLCETIREDGQECPSYHVPQVVRERSARTDRNVHPTASAGCARRSARTDRNVHPTASRRLCETIREDGQECPSYRVRRLCETIREDGQECPSYRVPRLCETIREDGQEDDPRGRTGMSILPRLRLRNFRRQLGKSKLTDHSFCRAKCLAGGGTFVPPPADSPGTSHS